MFTVGVNTEHTPVDLRPSHLGNRQYGVSNESVTSIRVMGWHFPAQEAT